MLTTSIYAAILGLVFVVLSVRTLLLRRQLQVSIGDGDQPILARAVRAHANFAEYVPLSLLLIYFLEVQTRTNLWIHILCSALVIGRITHAIGVSQVKENFRYRVVGMVITFTVIISASFGLMISYAVNLFS
jgi:uncharacterized protein